MASKDCVAMILAGGQGSRLGVLTSNIAKPAVPFGGKYRIIDFTLSNCTNSNMDTVGVLTQYQPLELNTYIGNGQPWDLDRNYGGVFVLPPYSRSDLSEWYKGTANAIYQNINFIEQFNPKYVLVLSGDHIYRMDYAAMLKKHIETEAKVTISVIEVDIAEASRFGIMTTDEEGTITAFQEKPKNPTSNLASMGIYIFDWRTLKRYLVEDENDLTSSNDFGKDIIPKMLYNKEKLHAHLFSGYWRDVGTIESLWQANMDLISTSPEFELGGSLRIFSRNPVQPPHFIGDTARVNNSAITEGCNIYGDVENSIISDGVHIFNQAHIKDSIIMPNVRIGYGVKIEKAIIGSGSVLGNFSKIGVNKTSGDNPYTSSLTGGDITVVAPNLYIDRNMEIFKGSMVGCDIIDRQTDFRALWEKEMEKDVR